MWWLREGCCIMLNGEKDGYLNWEKKVGSDTVVLLYYYYHCFVVRSRREQRKHSRESRCGGVCVGGLFVRAIICSVSTVTLTLYSLFSLPGPHLSPFSATLYSSPSLPIMPCENQKTCIYLHHSLFQPHILQQQQQKQRLYCF